MPRPAAPPRSNPLRDRPPIKKPPPLPRQAAAAAAAARGALRGQKRGCTNPTCTNPNIVDGTCHGCGFVVDDSNIVSEVQFGESSSGAAVVQGSFLGADQGSARTMGPAFARAGGGENREATIKEGRLTIQGMGSQFRISQTTVSVAVQIFKLAATMNFIQGRRMDMVCAVCLYTACRKSNPCPLMLIDFADRVQVNVFKLGVTFRALHKAIPGSGEGVMPILAEDLIWRFTSKLDFGELNDKVAEDAIRMSRRMSKDWMVMGRRPAGVVGACIIMAARMNNFRRTVTEVVYVVKVTTQTVTKRLEEFKETASSDMTVGEFLSNHFIETAQDPPSFYQQTDEWKSKQKKRKRRDMGNDGYNSEEEFSGDEGNSPDKRRRTEETNSGPAIELRKDADGFSIPPLPTPAPTATPASSATTIPISEPADMAEVPIDPELMDARIEKEIGATFQQLVNQFGDQLQDVEIADVEGNSDTTATEPAKRGRKPAQELRVSPEWANSERSWETEITEMISDPNTMQHAANYAMAKRRVAAHMLVAQIESPGRQISMDTHIGEDEFADDPEVQNCLLSEEDVKKKEMVWVNENQSWLRQQQKKMWDAKQAENRPPKARRNRKPKAQMGTGQKSPANSPAEAAINVLKERAFSKKINYKSMEDVFKNVSFLKNKTMGSAATSRASSEFGESETESASRAASEAPSINDSEHSFNAPPKSRGRPTPAADIDDDEEGDEDDYINPDAPESPTASRRTIPTEDETADDWKDGFEEGDEMEEDFDDAGMGDIEDDDDGAFAERDFGNDDDDDGYGVDDEY